MLPQCTHVLVSTPFKCTQFPPEKRSWGSRECHEESGVSWYGSLVISLSGDISCHLWQHWHWWLFLCVGAEKHQGRKKIIILHYSGTQRKVDSCCQSMKYPLSGQAPAWAGRRPPLHRNPSPRLQCGQDAAFGHRDQLPLPSCLGPRTDSAARRPGPLWLVTWPEPEGGGQSCAKSLCP